MIQRIISLALEFFKFAVMRRPDHKFRDQWRKADSALQPPFTYIRCPLFLHFERFLLTGNPFLRYTYMDLRIFFFVFVCCWIFYPYWHLHLFFHPWTDCGPLHLSCKIPSLVSQLERNSFFSKAHLIMVMKRKKEEQRGILSIMVKFNIRSQTLKLLLPQIRYICHGSFT